MKKVCTLLLVLSSLQLVAQSDSLQRSTSVVFFGPESTNSSNSSGKRAQAIKVGLFQCFSGMYGAYYEREFSDVFGVQAGIGLTGRNFLYGVLREDEGTSSDNSNFTGPNMIDLSENDYNYEDRDGNVGSYFSVSPKFYYTEDGMDGPYLAFNFQYRRYNMEAYATIPGDPDNYYYDNDLVSGSGNINEYENHMIYALTWGFQNTNSKTILDYYISGGLRNIEGRRRDLGEIYDPLSGEYTFMIATKTIEKSGLFFEVGFNLGIWWD